MPRQTVSDALKAQAIADLRAGDPPAVVAKRYGVSRDVAKQWKRRLASGETPPVSPATEDVSPPVSSPVSPSVQQPSRSDRPRRAKPAPPTPLLYYLQRGTPRDGSGGTLAGVAERGARLEIGGIQGGAFTNVGTKDAPQWERLFAELPGGRVPDPTQFRKA